LGRAFDDVYFGGGDPASVPPVGTAN
jgi:hypothetical protein